MKTASRWCCTSASGRSSSRRAGRAKSPQRHDARGDGRAAGRSASGRRERALAEFGAVESDFSRRRPRLASGSPSWPRAAATTSGSSCAGNAARPPAHRIESGTGTRSVGSAIDPQDCRTLQICRRSGDARTRRRAAAVAEPASGPSRRPAAAAADRRPRPPAPNGVGARRRSAVPLLERAALDPRRRRDHHARRREGRWDRRTSRRWCSKCCPTGSRRAG